MSDQNSTTPIQDFAQPAYLAYAMKTVKDRALPDVEDGLKPVHRRILFAMHQLKLLAPGAKPMKSARVVGDVIGKYHPHGDSAVYEAMVRMAQPFSLRYPLVHGEGNFGSRDGDSPAAMRYTEARLAPIAGTLLDELAWDTVDHQPTYDNTNTEPVLLPARLPFMLLNGTSGIAVGMATNLFSHNLREVVAASIAMIKSPKTTLDELLTLMPGPDLAVGCRLISSPAEIAKAYAEGRGALRVRAIWEVEHYGKGNRDWRLVVSELPPETSTAKIMIAINRLMDPPAPEKNGKKQPLKPEQLRLKKLFGDLIDEVRDSSDVNHPVRLVIEPKDRKSDPAQLAALLCAHTDMEMNISPNFVGIDIDGNPRLLGLRDWLSQWCQFRHLTTTRRLRDEKARVDHRLHILAGRLSILDRIEEVIALLKKSDNPRADLMERFGLSEVQVDDVLEMRLRQLANLERTKITDEQAKLLAEQARLQRLLSDDKALRKLIIKELEMDAERFGDDRRTRLDPDAPTVLRAVAEASVASGQPEPVAVALTERGWLAWRPAKSLEEALSADYKIKAGDAIRRVWFADRANHLLLLSRHGRGFCLRLLDLPSKSDTVPLTQFFDIKPEDAFLEAVIAASPEDQFLVASQSGYGFRVQASDWINRMKAGKALLTLAPTDTPLPPLQMTDPTADLLALSSDGRAVAFPPADVSLLPKGKGVKLIGLAPKAVLADLCLHSAQDPASLQIAGTAVPVPLDWVNEMRAPRSGRKGKPPHRKAAGTVFVRACRQAWQPPVA